MKLKEIKETDKAYFAGFFDGEGTVMVAEHQLVVSFGLTYVPILYKLKELFGGSICKVDMNKLANQPSNKKMTDAGFYNPERKQMYNYRIKNKEAWIFLKMIETYCEEKKEQVRTGIEFYNGVRIGRPNTERCEYYYRKLQELKHNKNNTSEESDIFINSQTKINLFTEE